MLYFYWFNFSKSSQSVIWMLWFCVWTMKWTTGLLVRWAAQLFTKTNKTPWFFRNECSKEINVGREHRLTQFMAHMVKSTTSGLKLQLLAPFSPACVLSCSDPAAPRLAAQSVGNPLSTCLITELTWDQQINQRPAVRCERLVTERRATVPPGGAVWNLCGTMTCNVHHTPYRCPPNHKQQNCDFDIIPSQIRR